MVKDFVCDQESAEQELEKFCEMMDIDIDLGNLDQEEIDAFNNIKRTLVKSIRMGNLTFTDDWLPVFHYTDKSGDNYDVKFKEPTGGMIQAMDKHKKNHDIAKTYAVLAEMTGRHQKFFAMMPLRQLKIPQSVMMLFLG